MKEFELLLSKHPRHLSAAGCRCIHAGLHDERRQEKNVSEGGAH